MSIWSFLGIFDNPQGRRDHPNSRFPTGNIAVFVRSEIALDNPTPGYVAICDSCESFGAESPALAPEQSCLYLRWDAYYHACLLQKRFHNDGNSKTWSPRSFSQVSDPSIHATVRRPDRLRTPYYTTHPLQFVTTMAVYCLTKDY